MRKLSLRQRIGEDQEVMQVIPGTRWRRQKQR